MSERAHNAADDIISSSDVRYERKVRYHRPVIVISSIVSVLSVLLASFGFVTIAFATALISVSGFIWVFRGMLIMMTESRKLTDDISRTSRDQQEVIAVFSHKIREPLNNLVVIGDLLAETTSTEKQRDLVETLIASSNNMVTTVNDLTMQSAGSMSTDKKRNIKFNLTGAIRNTIELYNLSGDVNIDLSIKDSQDSAFEIVGDPIVIKQIILDILNSAGAGKSGPDLKIEIRASLSELTDEMVTAKIEVSGNAEILPDLSEKDGSSLAGRLISFGEGEYSYSSSESVATITFSLPFRKAVTEKVHPVPSPKIAELRKETAKKKELSEINILLVEDNLINQKITFLTLKPLVKNIDTATNGREALDKIARADYDLILMDIQMPVMNGMVAAEKIRDLEKSTNSHIPIIAITANAMLGDKEKCLSAGMDDYISKPFQPAALIEKIRKFF
jgi:CheY-like chemotaxis protein